MEEIKQGSKLKCNDTEYVILHNNSNSISLCQLNTTKLIIDIVDKDSILNGVLTGSTVIEKIEQSECVELDKLSDNIKKEFEKRTQIINELEKIFAPGYTNMNTHGDEIENIRQKYSISKSKLWRLYRTYLQSGRQPNSLIDKRLLRKKDVEYHYKSKTGRPSMGGVSQGVIVTPEINAMFDYGVKVFKSGRCKSIRFAYEDMINKYFANIIETTDGVSIQIKPLDERPTYNQFYRYLNKIITPKKKKIIKTSVSEFRNDNRILYGDTLYGVMGPGDVFEMDECEVDIKLVSKNDPTQGVKRPVLYIMYDVFSRMVVGYSVSFENNSFRGFTNCMLSLIDDKVKLCNRLGLSVPERFWPSHILPNKIRCDNGSEYISYEVERIFNELGITQDIVPPGTGSLKPLVEQFFHQMHTAQNPLVENKGYISKRHDSNSIAEAAMNIEEFEKFVLMFIIEHNAKHMNSYPLNKDMIAEGFTKCPTPHELWNFGVNHYGGPKPIINEDQYRFTLLEKINSRLTRKGITYKGLYYNNIFDSGLKKDIYKIPSTSIPYETRIDTRDISNVYRMADHKIIATPLSARMTCSQTFAGWTMNEYESFIKEKKMEEKVANDVNMINSNIRKQKQLDVLKKSKGYSVETSKKNILENTQKEIEMRRKEEKIIKNINEIPYTSNDEPTKKIEYDENMASEDAALKALQDYDEEEFNEMMEDK